MGYLEGLVNIGMTDVILPYQPRDWQLAVHNSLKRFNVLVVARGSGKSVLAMNELIKQAMTGPANEEYAYILPQQNMARRNVWDHLKRFSDPIPGVHYDNQQMVVRYPNGAKILLLGSDNPDSMRGLHLRFVVLDEFDDMAADIWMVVRPMLTNKRGGVIFIGTPKGRKQLYDFYKRSQEPDRKNWYGRILTCYDARALSDDEIEQIKSEMSPEQFEQELLCNFDSALVGAYYGRQIAALRNEGRIAHQDDLYRSDLPVNTAFDLGIRDETAVWYFQLVGDQIHFIDYDCEANFGIPEWHTILKNKPFAHNYGIHIAPHDIKTRELGSGVSRLEIADQLGLHFEQCPLQDVMDGIEMVRKTLKKCRFDLGRCQRGVDAISAYRAKLDKDGRPLAPLHDWASHGADALRYCITYIEQVMNAPAFTRIALRRR